MELIKKKKEQTAPPSVAPVTPVTNTIAEEVVTPVLADSAEEEDPDAIEFARLEAEEAEKAKAEAAAAPVTTEFNLDAAIAATTGSITKAAPAAQPAAEPVVAETTAPVGLTKVPVDKDLAEVIQRNLQNNQGGGQAKPKANQPAPGAPKAAASNLPVKATVNLTYAGIVSTVSQLENGTVTTVTAHFKEFGKKHVSALSVNEKGETVIFQGAVKSGDLVEATCDATGLFTLKSVIPTNLSLELGLEGYTFNGPEQFWQFVINDLARAGMATTVQNVENYIATGTLATNKRGQIFWSIPPVAALASGHTTTTDATTTDATTAATTNNTAATAATTKGTNNVKGTNANTGNVKGGRRNG